MAGRQNNGNINPSPTECTKRTKRNWEETQDAAIMPVAGRKKLKAKTIEGVAVYSQEDLRNVGVTAKVGLDFIDAKADSDNSYRKVDDDECPENVAIFSQSPVAEKWKNVVDSPRSRAVETVEVPTWCSHELPSKFRSSPVDRTQKSCKPSGDFGQSATDLDAASPTAITRLKPFSLPAPEPVKFASVRNKRYRDKNAKTLENLNPEVVEGAPRAANSTLLVDYGTDSDSSNGSPESTSFYGEQSNLSVSKESDPLSSYSKSTGRPSSHYKNSDPPSSDSKASDVPSSQSKTSDPPSSDQPSSHSSQDVTDSWINVASTWTNMDETSLTCLNSSKDDNALIGNEFTSDPTRQCFISSQHTPTNAMTTQPSWRLPSSFMTPPASAFMSPVSPYIVGTSLDSNWTWPGVGLANNTHPNQSLVHPPQSTPPLSSYRSYNEGFRKPSRELFSSLTSSSETSSSSQANNRRYGPRFYLQPYDVDVLNSVDPSLTFIDTHCHLDFLFNRCNFKGSYSKYRNINCDTFHTNYEGCVAIFCDPLTFGQFTMWRNLLDEDKVWGAFGCHPHMAHSYDGIAEDYLKVALNNPKVVALGEIGLDYSAKNTTDHELQKQVFRRQLKIALTMKLPLVIHSRNAHRDTIDILREEIPKTHKIHRHCFTGDWKEAQIWLNEFPNLYLGLTALVTFPTAREVHEVARQIPLNRLLLETDAPYFLPRQAARELRWSHPGMAIHVAAQVAALRFDANIEDVLKATRANTRAMYGI